MVTVYLSQDVKDKLDRLQKEVDSKSKGSVTKTQVIDEALNLYDEEVLEDGD